MWVCVYTFFIRTVVLKSVTDTVLWQQQSLKNFFCKLFSRFFWQILWNLFKIGENTEVVDFFFSEAIAVIKLFLKNDFTKVNFRRENRPKIYKKLHFFVRLSISFLDLKRKKMLWTTVADRSLPTVEYHCSWGDSGHFSTGCWIKLTNVWAALGAIKCGSQNVCTKFDLLIWFTTFTYLVLL